MDVVVDVKSFSVIRCMCGLVADRGRTRGRSRGRREKEGDGKKGGREGLGMLGLR